LSQLNASFRRQEEQLAETLTQLEQLRDELAAARAAKA
jgi:hypothetical protein